MRILMVSMFSNHFFNWTEQLRHAGHEIYWIDVYDSNTYVEKIDFVHQIIGWRNRCNYPGRYWVKKNLPNINSLINRINQRKLSNFVDSKIQELKPDVIQTFVMQAAAVPLAQVIEKYPEMKWIYSAWGNDLYYRQTIPRDLEKIKKTLPNINYMFADCDRDYELSRALGFKGTYLGTFPGGGGYELNEYSNYIQSFEKRNEILVKGYQGKLGRCNNVLEALVNLKILLAPYNIFVFGASNEAIKKAKNLGLLEWKNFKITGKVKHKEVMKKMGEANIYIGNNISDGMPNTLLEAIVMGAFPIQSNPGGASAELINHGQNGLLINDPENVDEIKELLKTILADKDKQKAAIDHNSKKIKPFLEREYITQQVLKKYKVIEDELISTYD